MGSILLSRIWQRRLSRARLTELSQVYRAINGFRNVSTNFDTQEQTRNLYRSLLRQCTYLPDSVVRTWMYTYVCRRFRRRVTRITTGSGSQAHETPARIDNLRDARKAVLLLQRANAGHITHLRKVFNMVYGRTGPRRHQLLGSIKAPKTTGLSVSLQPSVRPRTDHRISKLNVTPVMRILIRSQHQRRRTPLSRAQLRHVTPQIPATNSWGRSLPLKRVRNIEKVWYARTLDRIQAPLPESDWMRLRHLASGQLPWGGNVPRRARCGASEEWAPDAGAVSHKSVTRTSNPHTINARFMRRMYDGILAQSPFIESKDSAQHDQPATIKVTWTEAKMDRDPGWIPQGAVADIMFAGVDPNGKRLPAAG